jgi:hypothetical protein
MFPRGLDKWHNANMAYIDFQTFFEVAAPLYQAVDVRTMAFCVKGQWFNTATVIRLCSRHQLETASQLRSSLKRYELVNNEIIRVHSAINDISHFEALLAQLRQGRLDYEEEVICLGYALDVPAQSASIHHNVQHSTEAGNPAFELHCNWSQPSGADENAIINALRTMEHDQKLRAYIEGKGYRDLRHFTQRFFAGGGGGYSFTSDVFLNASLPIRINRPTVTLVEPGLEVSIESDSQFADALVLGGCLGDNGQEDLVFEALSPQSEAGPCSSFCKLPPTVDLRRAVANISLSHPKLGLVLSARFEINDLLPVQVRNPLWFVFRQLCSPEELRNPILHPGRTPRAVRSKRRGDAEESQRLFEQHVAWFLTLSGFQTVRTEQFEVLREAATSVERGTVDILAFNEARKVMLFAACTINAVKEDHFRKLQNARALLLREFPEPLPFTPAMAVFTAAAGVQWEKLVKEGPFGQNEYIRIFGLDEMEGLLSSLDATPGILIDHLLSPVSYYESST